MKTPHFCAAFFFVLKMHMTRLFLLLVLLAATAQGAEPQNFQFMGSGDLGANAELLSRQDISGVQVIYNWQRLSTGRRKVGSRMRNSLHSRATTVEWT